MRYVLLASWLAASAGPTAASFAEVDELYFSRDQPGRLDRAIEALRLRLQEGDDPAALWRLGRCLIRKGRSAESKKARLDIYKEAERRLKRSVELYKAEPEAHFLLGLAYGLRGQVQGMMRSLFLVAPIRREMEAALALDPKHGPAHMLLAEMLAELPAVAGGSKARSLEHYEKAVAGEPGYTPPYPALARRYLEAGRIDEARALLERLLKVERPRDPVEAASDRAEGRLLLETLSRPAR